MLSQIDLRDRIVAFADTLPRTAALERRIRIGVGFHGKWYTSQREHWLGWITAKEYECFGRGDDPAGVPAATRWSGLHCMPMMVWLAEAAGVGAAMLDRAEAAASAAAAVNGADCPAHRKAIRAVLPWSTVEGALLAAPPPGPDARAAAAAAADAAFDRLASLRPEFGRLCDRTGPLPRHRPA